MSSVAAHSFNPSIRGAGASGSLSSRSVWSTQLVSGPPGPLNETLERGKRSPVMKSKIALWFANTDYVLRVENKVNHVCLLACLF